MVEHKQDVINLMEFIIENAQNWDSDILSSAKEYVEILQHFYFNFFLKIFSIILPQATIIFEILQKKCLILFIAPKRLMSLLFI